MNKTIVIHFMLIGTFLSFIMMQCNTDKQNKTKPRILISSDIGGTDPDDFQSTIHLLMYANIFQIEGLVSSPYGNGRKKDFLRMIGLYETDLPKLKKQSDAFPDAQVLRNLCKQGVIKSAPYKGYNKPTEGSDWIVRCAKRQSKEPLWILVWGGLEDLAQALHDSPEIKHNIRVYWIGGPNKKWSINAYAYIAENHPDLWIIEANSTYRGWFMNEDSTENFKEENYYGKNIQGRGAMGADFIKYYNGNIKMGDTPSLAYLMNGNPEDPLGESWGGSFIAVNRSSRYIFERNTNLSDTVATYATLEYKFKGPDLEIPEDSVCFFFEINKQKWPGFHIGNGIYGVRYSSKQAEIGSYVTTSTIAELNGQKGKFVSIIPWPAKPSSEDYQVGQNWYTDRPEPELFIKTQQGAKTISKFRNEYLLDWAKRWEWLK